jgi:hypothetical protein
LPIASPVPNHFDPTALIRIPQHSNACHRLADPLHSTHAHPFDEEEWASQRNAAHGKGRMQWNDDKIDGMTNRSLKSTAQWQPGHSAAAASTIG